MSSHTSRLGIMSCAIFVAACGVAGDSTGQLDAGAGDGATMRCAEVGTTPVTLHFINQRAAAVSLRWLNEACSEIPYASIAPGASATESTFVGHAWRIREGTTGDGEVIADYVAQATDAPTGTVIIPPIAGQPPVLCSSMGVSPVALRVVNQRSAPVSLFWIDSQCQEFFRSTLSPGRSFDEDSYVGHVWRVREGAQASVGAILEERVLVAADAPLATMRIAPPAGETPTVCSTETGAAVSLTVNNQSGGPVSIYWVNASCEPIFRETTASGHAFTQSTFVGHVWQVRAGDAAANGVLLQQFAPLAADAPSMTVNIP